MAINIKVVNFGI